MTVPGGRRGGRERWPTAARDRFMEAFSASYRG